MQDGAVTLDMFKQVLEERTKGLAADMAALKAQMQGVPAAVKADQEAALQRMADRIASIEAARQLIPDRAKSRGDWVEKLVEEARTKSISGMTRTSDGGVRGHDLIDLARIKSVISVDGGEVTTGSRYYDPSIIFRRQQRYRFVDLIPQIQIGEDETYVVDAESSRGGDSGAHGFVNQSGGAASGDSTVVLDDVSGLGAGYLLRFHLTGSVVEKTIVSADPITGIVTISGTFGTGIPDGTRWSTYRDFTATAERGTYPQTLIEIAPTTLTLQDLGVLLRCTERSLARANVRQHTFTRLLAKLRRNLNRHLLYGTGINRTLHGILTDTSLVNVQWSAQWSGATRGETAYSAAVDCLSDMDPVILLHPNDWKSIVAEKSSTGGYLHGAGSPIAVVDGREVKQLGPFQVETDGDLNEGDGLAFSPEEASALITSDEGTLAAGTVAPGIEKGWIDDDFARGQFALRAKQRCEHAVKIPEAARSIEFDQAPS